MDYTYANNQNLLKSISAQKEKFPEKELWFTEYGFLILDMFESQIGNTENSEMARLQFANSVGEAITNAEKVFNMLENGQVDMSSYHCFLDTQGFGIVGNNNKKMPMYYTMKKASELINQNTHLYSSENVYANSNVTQKGSTGSEYKKIDFWGFGDENGIECVVISNRNSNPQEFSLEGYELKPVWSYGSDEPLGEYLSQKESYLDVGVIPEPTTYTKNFTPTVALDGYSLTVCEIQDGETENAYISINNDKFNFMTEKLIVAGSDNIKLYKRGKLCECTITSLDSGYYQVMPQEGFIYDTDYTIEVGNFKRNFHTNTKPEFETYSNIFVDDFARDNGNWSYTNGEYYITGGQLVKYTPYRSEVKSDMKYDDFVAEFDFTPGEGYTYLEIGFRNGYVRIYPSGMVRKYFNEKNDISAGMFEDGFAENTRIKIAVYGNYAYIWAKSECDSDYTYICRIDCIASGEKYIKFNGEGKFDIDNVKITSPGEDANNVKFENGTTEAVRPLGYAEVDTNVYSDKTVLIAVYKNSRLKRIMDVEEYNNGYFADSEENIKIFVWESLETIAPVTNAYIGIDSSFLQR